ncbi:MAG: hypothetical protein VW339_04625 [Quisquiliibacterium sp.]
MKPEPHSNSPAEHWLDRPGSIAVLWRVFALALALTVIAEFLVSLHPHFDIEALPAFNALYGFGSCILMIVFAKLLALWLKRPDTYYDQGGGRDD